MCSRANLGEVKGRLRAIGSESERVLGLVDGDLTLSRDAARFRMALEMLTLGVEARLHWMDTKEPQDAARSPRTEQED